MGWTFTDRGRKSVADYLKDLLNYENDRVKQEVLDIASTWRAAYAAVKTTLKENGKSHVLCAVIAIKHVPRAADGYTFGYKDMDESMGPVESECPERILKLLSPIEDLQLGELGSKWAREWRERCWARIERMKQAKKLKPGATVKFDQPIRFTDGYEGDRFRVVMQRWRGRNRKVFEPIGGSGLYRINGLNRHPYTIETAE